MLVSSKRLTIWSFCVSVPFWFVLWTCGVHWGGYSWQESALTVLEFLLLIAGLMLTLKCVRWSAEKVMDNLEMRRKKVTAPMQAKK